MQPSGGAKHVLSKTVEHYGITLHLDEDTGAIISFNNPHERVLNCNPFGSPSTQIPATPIKTYLRSCTSRAFRPIRNVVAFWIGRYILHVTCSIFSTFGIVRTFETFSGFSTLLICWDVHNFRVVRTFREFRHFRDFQNFRDVQIVRDFANFRKIQTLRDFHNFRDFRKVRDCQNVRHSPFSGCL